MYLKVVSFVHRRGGEMALADRHRMQDRREIFGVNLTEIAQQAGLWRRKYGRGHGTSIMDALIAACADSLRAPFW